MQSSPSILHDSEKGSRLQWGKAVTGYPKTWNEHPGRIRAPDIRKEPAVVEANCRYAKKTKGGFSHGEKGMAGTVKSRQNVRGKRPLATLLSREVGQ